jgi:uncharacterized protein with PIN domain
MTPSLAASALEGQLGPDGMRQAEAFFRRAGIILEPVTVEHGELARQVFLDFGEGATELASILAIALPGPLPRSNRSRNCSTPPLP